MFRIGIFLMTNLAVMLVAGIMLNLLGVESYIQPYGINFTSLLIFCAIFGFSGAMISLFISKWIAKKSTQTKLIETPETQSQQWLLDTVHDLADQAGIGHPEIGIFPMQQANAFATGWNRNNALVAVSRGLLEKFNRDQTRAVLAHEIGHIANGDMVTLALIQGIINTFVMFFARVIGYSVDKIIFKNQRGHGIGFWVTTIFAEIVLGILASTIVFWFSRRREYRADEMGAKLAGKNSMIAALEHLQQINQPGKEPLPDSLSAFGIAPSNATKLSKTISGLFSTHPPLEERIQALRDAPY